MPSSACSTPNQELAVMKTDSPRLLLIEDDEEDCYILKKMLSDYSSKIHLDWVDQYEDGYKAITSCRYDAVLLDYSLGARNGIELLHEVRERGCDVPIIMLTGRGGYELDVQAMKAGAADYLVKGQITPEMLERSIRYAIERRHSEAELKKYRDHLKELVEDLETRTQELARANRALRLNQLRFEALLELSQMTDASMKQVSTFVVDQLVKLTGSKAGWLGFTNEEETAFIIHSCSMSVQHECGDLPVRYSLENAGIWSDTIQLREPIIVNGSSSLLLPFQVCPNNRLPLFRFMSVPVLDGDRVAGVALVGNKDEDYDQSDVLQLTLLMDGIWKLIQRDRTHKALHEAESLAAMGRAISSVAHDLKTPLIAIGGFSSMVHKHLPENNPDRAKLEIVVKETRRLENMVREMLDFSRPLELHRTRGDLGRFMDETILVIQAAARERQVKLDRVIAENLPPVSLDFGRMKQVIINLVSNAVQASPEGETVMVSVHMKRENLLVDVKDCGCGIPVDKRQEIFLPFVSFKKEGTGLGLPIVKKIVEAHGGRIHILDNNEGGVTFRLVIPCNTSDLLCEFRDEAV